MCVSEVVHLQRLPADLLHRARAAIERQGFCIFDAGEMERLLTHAKGPGQVAKQELLSEFAEACGATVETTKHFTSARFAKLSVSAR